jgi:hypothetical protein
VHTLALADSTEPVRGLCQVFCVNDLLF